MQQIISTLGQKLQKSILVLGLMTLISLSGLFIFVSAPAWATTSEELKLIPASERLTSEEKIDRAYIFRQGAGALEEVRQEKSPNKAEPFDPIDKANVESVKASKEKNPEPSLGEQVQKAFEKVIGKE